ncbi:MAG TPA: hypothetical protein DHW45_04680, partial [Candidatus Latescibacteria bacterium]|nr:hypothetical protein [Candidatus Latescibacterota bacterium]
PDTLETFQDYFERHHFVGIPVVDEEDRLIGPQGRAETIGGGLSGIDHNQSSVVKSSARWFFPPLVTPAVLDKREHPPQYLGGKRHRFPSGQAMLGHHPSGLSLNHLRRKQPF